MKRHVLYLLMMLCSVGVHGQNMVPNPSFEQHNDCPGYGYNITYSTDYTLFPTVTDWATPFYEDYTSYYSGCATVASGQNVPYNAYGYRPARTGDAYIGMVTVWGGNQIATDLFGNSLNNINFALGYAETKLMTPMQAGHQYYGSFYVCRSPVHTADLTLGTMLTLNHLDVVATDQAGMLFTDTMINSNGIYGSSLGVIIDAKPSIGNPAGNFITDTLNWTKVEGFYTAHGGEQWLTLGPIVDTPTDLNNYPVMTDNSANYYGSLGINLYSYYFIDDVCVVEGTTTSRDSTLCHVQYPVVLQAPVHADAPHYGWINGDTTATFSANDTGTYWVRSTGACAYYIDTIKLRGLPAPVINLGADPHMCRNWPLQLAASGGQNYIWSPATYLSCDSCVGPVANPPVTTTYSVMAISDSGCTSVSQLTIFVDSAHVAFSKSADSLCAGTMLTLTNNSFGDSLSYIWRFGDGDTSNSINSTHVYDSTGTMQVTLLATNTGCKDSTIQPVVVYVPPAISLSIPDSVGCIDKPFTLDAGIPAGYVSFLWNFGDSTQVPGTAAESTHAYNNSGTYFPTLSVTYPGCPAITVSNDLTVLPPPFVDSLDTVVCLHAVAPVINVTGDTITWYTAANPKGTSVQPVINTADTGTYTFLVSGTNYCGTSGKVPITVSVIAPPAQVPLSNIALCNGEQVRLTSYGPDASYRWNTGDSSCCITISDSGAYKVQVTNVCGEATDTTNAEEISCNACIWVPSAFTPNGDGKNDVFRPINRCEPFSYYHLIIVDRWGQTVFETVNIEEGWDGTFKGRPVNVDTYYYLIEAYVSGNAKPAIIKGDVTVVK